MTVICRCGREWATKTHKRAHSRWSPECRDTPEETRLINRDRATARRRARGAVVSADIEGRFWARVDKTGDCWEWRGPTYPSGYGQGAKGRAHRRAWEFVNGPIPDGLVVCHRCDNRLCVRPDHLFLGTHLDNMRDMQLKGRQRYPAMRLNEEDILRIRQLRASGRSVTSVAREFGLSELHTRRIASRASWAHIK